MRTSLLILLILVGGGCATDPAPPSGFLAGQDKDMKHRKGDPFQRVWVKPNPDWSRFANLYIAPVNTDRLLEIVLFPGGGSTKTLASDLGVYFTRKLREAFAQSDRQRFQVIDSKAPATLVLEIAWVELKPANAPGNLKRIQGRATAAFEARIRDGLTGEVLAAIADRRADRGFTLIAEQSESTVMLKAIIDEWAQEFATLANKPRERAEHPENKKFEMKTPAR